MLRWMGPIVLAACKSGPFTPASPAPTDLVDTDTDVVPPTETGGPTPPPTPVPAGPEALALPAPAQVDNGRFATSDTCIDCHSNHANSTAMRDGQGNAVGMYDTWEASMMANAARDPIWRAVVSAEIAATPGAADVIGERCMTCHAPMASTDAALTASPLPTVATLSTDTPVGKLGLDGVSCTLCHQMDPSNWAGEESWKGRYLVETTQTLYGPHATPDTALMAPSGWTPAEGGHMTDPRLCATCHTLITDALAPDGTPTGGHLVEQAPYLEMRNSSSSNSSCQNCHLPPRADDESGISTHIARDPAGTDFSTLNNRSMARHVLVGGNTLGPQLFATFHDELQPRASVAAFQAKETAARLQLQTKTAFLQVLNPTRAGATLSFTTHVEPRTGHKFPTGIPLRRAWLQVTVHDGGGNRIFASGTPNSRGVIVDSQNNPMPFELAGGPIEPHHDQISNESQVQIYEAIMQDDAGDLTFLLLRGAGFMKDNRLLPLGWSPSFVDIDRIAPQGVNGDVDYISGADSVHWTLDLGAASGPFSIEARLNYQTLSTRFAEELFLAETPETQGLRAMLQAVATAPEVVALTALSVP